MSLASAGGYIAHIAHIARCSGLQLRSSSTLVLLRLAGTPVMFHCFTTLWWVVYNDRQEAGDGIKPRVGRQGTLPRCLVFWLLPSGSLSPACFLLSQPVFRLVPTCASLPPSFLQFCRACSFSPDTVPGPCRDGSVQLPCKPKPEIACRWSTHPFPNLSKSAVSQRPPRAEIDQHHSISEDRGVLQQFAFSLVTTRIRST